MNDGYVYEQFGVWWVFLEPAQRGPIHLTGPYRTRDHAQQALASFSINAPPPRSPLTSN